ncbi:MAG: dihydrofolate reductase [Verrucomicrobiales bacterium]
MIISLIVALDEDDAIGKDEGGLPWHLPAEIRHFRAYCRGRWMLLGRRTFDEMHGWFKDHTVLVLTHHPGTLALPGRAVDSVKEAIAIAQKAGVPELVVAGGAEVFALTIPLASRLVLSRIHTHSGGTVKFPPFKPATWHEVSRQDHREDEENRHAFTICVLERTPRM